MAQLLPKRDEITHLKILPKSVYCNFALLHFMSINLDRRTVQMLCCGFSSGFRLQLHRSKENFTQKMQHLVW